MLAPLTKITGSTPDEVIEGLYPSKEAVLARFDEVRRTANVADAERDRLRDYINTKVPAGRYGKFILAFRSAGSRCYANSQGLHALESYALVKVTDYDMSGHELTEEVTIRNAKGEILMRGTLGSNTDFYQRKDTYNIVITEIPNVIPIKEA